MINRELVSYFSKIIGYIDILLELDGFSDVFDYYKDVRKDLVEWVTYYYKNKSFSIITYERSLEIHDILQDIRDEKIFDKSLGIEAMLTDDIFIMYETIVKMINDELK